MVTSLPAADVSRLAFNNYLTTCTECCQGNTEGSCPYPGHSPPYKTEEWCKVGFIPVTSNDSGNEPNVDNLPVHPAVRARVAAGHHYAIKGRECMFMNSRGEARSIGTHHCALRGRYKLLHRPHDSPQPVSVPSSPYPFGHEGDASDRAVDPPGT